MLRNEVKWTTWLSNAEVIHAKVVPNETDNVSSPSDPFRRPPGRDRTKKAHSGNASMNSTACIEMIEKFQLDRAKFEEQAATSTNAEREDLKEYRERKMKLSEDMFKLQQQERDDRIMNMDLDKVAPYARNYYLYMQKAILSRLPPPEDIQRRCRSNKTYGVCFSCV
jgi:cell division protein FtsB